MRSTNLSGGLGVTTRNKNKWNYEKDVPVCGNCTNLKPSTNYMVNSRIRTSAPFCKKGNFFVKLGAVCDMWNGKDGATLTPNVQGDRLRATTRLQEGEEA